MKKIVFWTISSRYVKLFWIKKCDDAIKNTRRFRRRWSFTQNASDWSTYIKTNDYKQKLFKKSKKSTFVRKLKRRLTLLRVYDDSRSEQKTRTICFEIFSKCSFSSSIIARLTYLKKKINIFKDVFFSTSFSIDLIDISRFFYLNSIECFSSIIKKKVLIIIKWFVFDKTSNLDDFINKLFKTCVFIMIRLLTFLFEICVQLFYHLKTFKKVNTIILKKVNKIYYTISKTYRLITFLNIMNKIMKSIMSKKIAWLTKSHRFLLDSHIKCCKNKLIELILKLLTKQIHIVWNKNTNWIVILLSLNVIEIFDTISHNRLIYDLRKRRISKRIIDWMINFLQNRTITLTMNCRTIVSFLMRTRTF